MADNMVQLGKEVTIADGFAFIDTLPSAREEIT